jgi:hypothetical protein
MATDAKNRMYDLIEIHNNSHSYLQLCRVIDSKINFRNLDVVEWFEAISCETKKWKFNDDEEYIFNDKERQRALKKLSKIATEARIEPGYFLASMFSAVCVDRGVTTTEIIDGTKMDDFTRDPYDFDFAMSLGDLPYNDDNKHGPMQIYTVVTYDANQVPVCPNCEGEGFFQCEKCEGSGREQYIDGYFANGEERIKTGQCSSCYGAGKIRCKRCLGSGKCQLLSNQYQIVKKFGESKFDITREFVATTFKDDREVFISTNDKEIWSQWGISEADIRKLYRNQNEVIIDRNQILPNGINAECEGLYEKNKKAWLSWLNKIHFNECKLVCSIEKHFAIPLFRIYFSTKLDNEERCINIYENQDKKAVCSFRSLPDLSFFKSLFL